MTAQRTQRPPSRPPFARLALLLACLFAAGEVAATAQVRLNVQVNVVDENNIPLKDGQVIIKRIDSKGGTPKEGKIHDGVALVTGDFYTSKAQYGVTVDAGKEYQQTPSPYLIPEGVLSATSATGEVTLPQPIKVTSAPKSEGTPEPTGTPAPATDTQSAELKQQSQLLLEQLKQRPELFDQLLAQIAQEPPPPQGQEQQGQQQQAQPGAERNQPVLRERLVRYLQANPHLLSEGTPVSPLLKYWWAIALLLVLLFGFVVWLLIREVNHYLYRLIQRALSDNTLISSLPREFGSLRKGQDMVMRAMKCGTPETPPGAQQPETKKDVQLEVLPSVPPGGDVGASPPASLPRDVAADGAARAPDARAREYFRNLVSNQQSVPEQRYLELDDSVKSSPTSMIQRGKVSLQEVSHPGVFVLYADDGGEGWVFPNPHRNYSKPALEMLFPDLDDKQFESSKDTIHPVHVVRDGDRWRVQVVA